MQITVLGAESLGVRGLSCMVEVQDRRIVIDPGLALGYRRHGLLPHPLQVAVGESIRRRIVAQLREASDVVISHFHGDHMPLPDANPYQLQAQRIAPLCRHTRLWTRGPEGLSQKTTARREALAEILNRDLPNAEGLREGSMAFSLPVAHGELDGGLGKVMMTRVADSDGVFVHASDIQLLNEEAVSRILDWQPNVVLAAGPPLYLGRLSTGQVERAWDNGMRLARNIDILILDHHLLRSYGGLRWLDRLSAEAGHGVICAADFMGVPRRLLEARRAELYEEMPVPRGWHRAYARGDADAQRYANYAEEHSKVSNSMLEYPGTAQEAFSGKGAS